MPNIERRIITGLIVSADYLRRVAPFWQDDLVEAPEMARIARWCLNFWEKYERAPDRDIEQVFFDALRAEGIPKAEAQLIEAVLEKVSDDYERGDQFNAEYLFDQTVQYFRDREIAQWAQDVEDLRERGRLKEAEELASQFQAHSWATSRGLELGSEQGYDAVRSAFEQSATPIVTYPGALGSLLNRHLIRGGFVSYMGPEKVGKTFWLTDIALRALRAKCNVAFFQAGDLTQSQYLRRMAVHLARRSDDPEYCMPHWRPVGDCVLNQFDRCNRADRNCDHGVLSNSEYEGFVADSTKFQKLDALSKLAESDRDYAPCDSDGCTDRKPCVWLTRVDAVQPLSGEDADKTMRGFFRRYRRRFKLVTYPSGTLTCDEIDSCLAEWERQDDFVADVVAVDYADIMAAREREYRHRQNEIWLGLRGISQKHHALVVSATQTDTDSYKTDILTCSNFSEDKRKYGHVTAMWGLNQDHFGREKELGVMRINTIVVREGAFRTTDVVVVLQHLAAGRPFTESFREQNSAIRVPDVVDY